MKIPLILIYLLNLCLDWDQSNIVIPLGQSKELTMFSDLDPILKVIHQLTKVDFIAINEIFFIWMDTHQT